ncbi:TIGR01458 family HAD-type hydrolase [Aidingimonas halophila]|uniref:Haloacid dehalogenase-like hydrolase domain-containing protein 2 n=1 Tax=Aidingimonas halophila TaxID=574349 RepID=A0A1H2SM64_9GAMM|nr:TIGR01458 family HAD-type hydrolase [Aidingimonas halophila]GHC17508.1 hydrolase [Aidingimonas halophila]SDW32174.1 HAD-superfamily subfamily IIA hydrolase, TIGR01458 [Aidingimonas halophila]
MPQAVLLDISGVLHEDGIPLPYAVEAVRRLQEASIALRFITNTSRKTGATVYAELLQMGFEVERSQIHTAPSVIKRYILQHGLRPYLLIHDDLVPEFDDLDCTAPNAVVVCDAEHRFDYAHLDDAFQVLNQGAPLLAVGTNRYFHQRGGLHLDAGPFVKALEYAADTQALVLGKPAAGFFHGVLEEVGIEANQAMMVGDDAEADVAAAMQAGLQGCLVQTGKYRDGDERWAPDCRLESSLMSLVAALD